jgi:hypothetical protein
METTGEITGNVRTKKPPLCACGLCADRSIKLGTAHVSRKRPMKKLVLAIVLIASPAWAQVKLVPKNVATRADPCAPIGQTADRQLIYPLNCNNLPAPPPPPVQVEAAPPPEPEVQRSGLFGMSFSRPGSSMTPAAPAGPQ